MTVARSFWDVSRWNQTPIIASTPPSGSLGQEVPFEFAESTNADAVALRVRPDLWRPGATGWVEFQYPGVTSGVWTADTDIFDITPGTDPNFVTMNPNFGVVVFDGQTLIDRDTYSVRASGANNEQLYIDPINSGFTNLDVTVKYKAVATIPASSTQAISDSHPGLDQFPLDIFIKDDTIKPFTIVPINTTVPAVDDALSIADANQFTVYVWLDYRGVAYNANDDTVWFVENNNQQVHIYNRDPLSLKERKNLYMADGARRFITPTGTATTYPFETQALDTSRTAGANAIHNDFLYIVDETDMHQMNVFDDTLSIINTFTVPTAITDLSVSLDGNLLASIGNGITELILNSDYFTIDNQQGFIYYRERYGYVDVSGVRDD